MSSSSIVRGSRAAPTRNRYNLLSFIQSDSEPPFRLSDFWTDWDWYIKPLLSSYVRRGGIDRQASVRLPPLWPADMFALHRLQARKLFDELAASTGKEVNNSPADYLSRMNDAHARAIRRACTRSFGKNALNAAGHGTVRPWVRQICTLVDPYSFPLESVIYQSQRNLAEALEIIEQNSSTLERYRREVVTENMHLYEEVKRLQSMVYILERLETNLNRIIQ